MSYSSIHLKVSALAIALFFAVWIFPAEASLVNHWSFDNIVGATVADAGSGENAGTIDGATVVPGILGDALSFDGSGDNVVFSGYKGITGTGARSVAFWVKTDGGGDGTPSSSRSLIGWGGTDNGATWAIGTNTSGGNGTIGGVRLSVTAGYATSKTAVTSVEPEWELVVVSVGDGFNVDSTIFHVEGENDGISNDRARDINTGSDWDVIIGLFPNPDDRTNNGPFKGLMDDVSIWDEALTDGMVKGLFDVGDQLKYDAGRFNDLKTIYTAQSGTITIDNLKWSYEEGLVGDMGLSGGGNEYTLILDDAGRGLTAIPEPTAGLLWAIGGLSIFYIRRKFHS